MAAEQLGLIALGGMIGANARYLVTIWAARRFGTRFPLGTLLANVSGCFLLGLVSSLASGWLGGDKAGLFLATGLLGSYTTFSTYAYESVLLVRHGKLRAAMLNVVGSVVLGLLAATLGIALGGLVP